jgi:hypothetical protein
MMAVHKLASFPSVTTIPVLQQGYDVNVVWIPGVCGDDLKNYVMKVMS